MNSPNETLLSFINRTIIKSRPNFIVAESILDLRPFEPSYVFSPAPPIILKKSIYAV